MKELLQTIIGCDMEKPYIFISYSSEDRERVWRDVRRFQQMGYNVWLDEKNLDKSNPSWRNDAIEAIRDINCRMLIFYVSSNSLASANCYQELCCTQDKETTEIHFGSVKFVAVDVESILDIRQFCKELHTKISRSSIPRQIKNEQARTVTRFLDRFFSNSNDKIRIAPFDATKRKRDYYEEIAAVFPEETHINDPLIPEEAAAPEKQEADVQQQSAVPAEVGAIASQVFRTTDMQATDPDIDGLWDIAYPEFAEPEPSALQGDAAPRQINLTDVAKEAMKRANQELKELNKKWRFMAAENQWMPVLSRAQKYITGSKVPLNAMVGVLDTHPWVNCKEGFVLTQSKLFHKMTLTRRGVIHLLELASVEDAGTSYSLCLGFLDGTKETVFLSEFKPVIKVLLQTYLDAAAGSLILTE